MNANQFKIYSFLGLPGSGKGTQAEMFAEKSNLELIGIGNIVREEMAKNKDSKDPFINEIKKRYNKGLVQPDGVVFDLLEKKLNILKSNNSEGVVLDNFPLTKGQGRFLEKFINENNCPKPTIIIIEIKPKTAVKRILLRKVCPECKAIYIGKETNVCEKCGTALVSRSDDNEETTRERINQYLPRIQEVTESYKDKWQVLNINGEGTVEEVKKEIDKI